MLTLKSILQQGKVFFANSNNQCRYQFELEQNYTIGIEH